MLSVIETPWRAQDSIFAFDRESVRELDTDGRLHVAHTNISKANVCPYFGREIPRYEEMGLDPNRKYRLLRHPEELAKAAPTFNNLPLLSEHVPISAADHRPELVIGSTGTDASFEPPYLKNSLVVWPQKYIDKINRNAQKELSSAYRYDADMTPGIYEGEAYDGIMRNIVGNHVALVKEGRAGPDVVVGDSKENLMSAKSSAWYFRGIKALGAVQAYLTPRLAQDAKVDLTPIFAGVGRANFQERQPAIVAAILAEAKGKLAKDAKLDGEGLKGLLDAFSAKEPTPDEMATMPNGGLPMPPKQENMDAEAGGEGGGQLAQLHEFLSGKLSPEDMATVETLIKAAMEPEDSGEEMPADDAECPPGMMPKKGMDEPPAFKGMPKVGGQMDKAKDKMMPEKGMDAAAVESRIMQRLREVKDAENFVQPIVGRIAVAQDSADGVYRAACKIKGIDVSAVKDTAALRIILGNLPKASAKAVSTERLASDAATTPDALRRYGLEGEAIRHV